MQAMEEDIVIGKNDKLVDITKLADSEKYQSIMSQVRAALSEEDHSAKAETSQGGPLLHAEDDPTYKYVFTTASYFIIKPVIIFSLFSFRLPNLSPLH
jgi:hypothetical protein